MYLERENDYKSYDADVCYMLLSLRDFSPPPPPCSLKGFKHYISIKSG